MKSVEAQFEKIVVAKAKGAGEQTANLAIDAFHLSAGQTGVVKLRIPLAWRRRVFAMAWSWRIPLAVAFAAHSRRRARFTPIILLPKFAQFLFEQAGALERSIDFQASLQSLGGVPFQVVPAMQQQPSQALNGFLGRSVLRFPASSRRRSSRRSFISFMT